MSRKPKKGPREKDLTSRYKSGELDADRVDASQRFSTRNKNSQQDRTLKTAQLRADGQAGIDIDTLPEGEVVQVHSLFCHVQHDGTAYRCVVRRTLTKVGGTYVVVGDRVRFRAPMASVEVADTSGRAADAPAEGVIEQILPRKTVLTRADSFKGTQQHPIVANAEQMLIVVSIRQPRVKWGLVDRMIVAARSGGLLPIVCLNKIDLAAAGEGEEPPKDRVEAEAALAHYATLGVPSLQTSVDLKLGLVELQALLRGKSTVLAGHSGVGKSSLIRAIEPTLDIRVGEVSRYTDKGRHTTTSARRYVLAAQGGGAVIDTPGVKLFGLWGVTPANLAEHFPDVGAGTAPDWRRQSFERIAESLPEEDLGWTNT